MINTDDGFNPYDYKKSYENGVQYNNCTINIYNSDNKGIDLLKQKLEAEEKRFDLLYNFITKNIERAIETFAQKQKKEKKGKKKDEPVDEPYSYQSYQPISKDEPKHNPIEPEEQQKRKSGRPKGSKDKVKRRVSYRNKKSINEQNYEVNKEKDYIVKILKKVNETKK